MPSLLTRKPLARTLWPLLGTACLLLANPAGAESYGAASVASVAASDIAGFNAATNNTNYRRQLIGFFVDDRERSSLFALENAEGFLIPLYQVLDDIGARLEEREGEPWIVTPSGDIALQPDTLKTVEGKLMIQMSALSEQLQLRAEFDTSAYALRLSLPWDPQSKSTIASRGRTVNFKPPSASLRNMRADMTYLHNDEINDVVVDYFMAGNLASGTWQTRIDQNREDDLTPFDYYWHRTFETTQVLLGNSTTSVHPLLPSVEQTGTQVLYSNTGFKSTSSRVLTSADGAREVGSGTRRIEGSGEPGSIAQLRINGGVVARTRVRLDGTFEFNNIEVSTRGRSEIKVLLLDRTSGVLMDTLDYSRRGDIGMLSGGQHTVFVAAGKEGNPLEDDDDSRGTAGAIQYRQGITDNLTVEAAYQDNGDDGAGLVGASMSFAKHWFGSLAYATEGDEDALELTLDGGNGEWEVDLTSTEYWPDGENQSGHQWVRYGNYRHFVTDRLTLGLSGRDADTDIEDESFLLPTASWSDGRRFWASAWPNIEGKYRLDSRYNATEKDSVRYTYEDESHRFDYRHKTDRSMDYYVNLQDGENIDPRAEAGAIYYSTNPLLERVQFGLVGSDNQLGYVAEWDARLMPGVYSRLQMYDTAYSSDEFALDQGFTVQWDLSLDFAISRGRVVPASTNTGRVDSAAVTGPITINGHPPGPEHNIDRLVVVVDGVSHTALVQGGQFYVDGLLPGVRRVSLDNRHLPIEMVPAADQVYWVELARSAATTVPFELEVRYAIAGKVVDAAGTAQPGQRIEVLDSSGQTVNTLASDQFGFYRADNLAPGNYIVRVVQDNAELVSRNVTISDGFLFGQDLLLP